MVRTVPVKSPEPSMETVTSSGRTAMVLVALVDEVHLADEGGDVTVAGLS